MSASTSVDASSFLRAGHSRRHLYSWYDSVTKRSQTDGNAATGSALMRVKRSNLPAAVLFYIGLILSVTAIVVVLVNIYQRRTRASQEQNEEEKKEKQIEDSIKTKRELLKKTTMVIEEEDFVRIQVATKKKRKDVDLEAGDLSKEEESDLDDTNSRVSDVSILHLMDDYKEREERPPVLFWASTHCAICLGEYEPGDAVTWSTNPRCHHAYHNECLFSWFSKGNDTCPFCREEFCPEECKEQKAGGKAGENQSRMQQVAARSA